MIVKITETRYVNLDNLKTFKLEYNEQEDSCVLYFGDGYALLGDHSPCSEWWCGVVRKYLEIALKDNKPFFDLNEMSVDGMNDTVKYIHDKEKIIQEAKDRREAERLEKMKKITNPKGQAL